MDARIINGYFIGYPTKSKGYVFYCSTHSTRIVETGHTLFIENGETSGIEASKNVEITEVRVQVPLTSTSTLSIVVPNVVESPNNEEEQKINDHEVNNEPVVEQAQEIVLRRSQRERKSSISNDYVVYLQESKNDLGIDNDPISFSEAINGDNPDKWLDAMKDELKINGTMMYETLWNFLKDM